MSKPRIKSRKPTGAVPWPLILVEGGEKSGKSWAAAEFTADPRIGQAYWIDLNEGAADEYGAIPGANYEVIEHDGTWRDIIGQVEAVRDEAQRANDAGEPPVVLVIDSMTAEWDMLKDWATARALASKYAERILKRDPNAEIKPDNRLWNDANQRHATLMRMLMTFPGIVVMTARGKEVAKMGDDGKPVAGDKEYRVEGQKNLAFDASAWVRLSRTAPPTIIGARSVTAGIQPGVDEAKPAKHFTIAWLVFDVLKCDPKTATVRDLRPLDSTPEETAPPEPDPGQGEQPPSVADRARAAVARSTMTPVEIESRVVNLRANIDTSTTKEELGALWKAAGDLPNPQCAEVRAYAEAAVKKLAGDQTETPAA